MLGVEKKSQCCAEICAEQMKLAIETKRFELLESVKSKQKLKDTRNDRWGHRCNVYVQMKGQNIVILHTTKNRCIFIPKTIVTKQGKIVDVVEILSKYFIGYNGNNSTVIVRLNRGQEYIYRVIMAIYLYGDAEKKLPAGYDVHHKISKAIHLLETLELIKREEHYRKHSSENEGKKNKRHSIEVGDTVDALVEACEKILRDVENCKEMI